jgi:hypothetical protein
MDGFLCLGRKKTPAELNKAIIAIINNANDIVARSYIVAWVKVAGDLLNLKLLRNASIVLFRTKRPGILYSQTKFFHSFFVFYILLYVNAFYNPHLYF